MRSPEAQIISYIVHLVSIRKKTTWCGFVAWPMISFKIYSREGSSTDNTVYHHLVRKKVMRCFFAFYQVEGPSQSRNINHYFGFFSLYFILTFVYVKLTAALKLIIVFITPVLLSSCQLLIVFHLTTSSCRGQRWSYTFYIICGFVSFFLRAFHKLSFQIFHFVHFPFLWCI